MENKYATYRQIRYNRTYRTLGKMSWWRVALGVALLILVLFLSGAVSDSFAVRGHFKTARALILSESWMETYRPDDLGYIEAGVLYEEGDYEAALEAFEALGEQEAALKMRDKSALALAGLRLEQGRRGEAAALWESIEPSRLSEAELERYEALKPDK